MLHSLENDSQGWGTKGEAYARSIDTIQNYPLKNFPEIHYLERNLFAQNSVSYLDFGTIQNIDSQKSHK